MGKGVPGFGPLDPGVELDQDAVAFFKADPSRVDAVAHPTRLKVMSLASAGEVSAKEAAAELREPISKVSYHFRVLADAGLLALVRQTPRRGAVESHYRAAVVLDLDSETWHALDPYIRRRYTLAVMEGKWADIARSADEGGFEVDGSLFAHCHFEADRQAASELRQAVEEYYQRLVEIDVGLSQRRAASPEDETTGIAVNVCLMGGERSRAAHGPTFNRHSGDLFALIPDDSESE